MGGHRKKKRDVGAELRAQAKANEEVITRLWLDEYTVNNHCALCANSGIINTLRVPMHTAAGLKIGIRTFCICPNGRAMKEGDCDLDKTPDGHGIVPDYENVGSGALHGSLRDDEN